MPLLLLPLLEAATPGPRCWKWLGGNAGPLLAPGIIDYFCIVGARDIGDQKSDDGSRGWVTSQPECVVVEQFPRMDGGDVCCAALIVTGDFTSSLRSAAVKLLLDRI